MDRLSETELAERAATTVERVRLLTDLGILRSPGGEGYPRVDINRIRLAEALEGSGISLEDLGGAVQKGIVSLDFIDHFWPDPSGFVPGMTMADMARESGLSWEAVELGHVRLGLPRPSPEAPVREDDAPLFPASQMFMGAGLDESAMVRFSRVMGDNLRRLAEAQVHFFKQTVIAPMIRGGLTAQQAWDNAASLAPSLTPLFQWLLVWLYWRHWEHYVLQDVLEQIEGALDEAGLGRPRPANPPAIEFLDLSGYTRLTEERGDEAAAELARTLAELVQEAAHLHAGKLVKLLGDGVMFYFAHPSDAVRCALRLVGEASASGLPPAHVGVDAGPVVFQDGDYFGRTVNVAARIAAKAGPGQVLVSDAVVNAVQEDGVAFRELGPAELKGVERPVVLHEARGAG